MTPRHLQIAAWIGVFLAVVQVIPFLTGRPKLSDFFLNPSQPKTLPRFEEPASAKNPPSTVTSPPPLSVNVTPAPPPLPRATPFPITPQIRAESFLGPAVPPKPIPQAVRPQNSPPPGGGNPVEKKKVPIYVLGKVSATIEFARLSERGRLEVPVTFINTGPDTCWIIPAEGVAAQASDNAKGTYQWNGAKGFFRSPLARARGLSSSSHQFLQLDPGIAAIGILQFGRDHDSSARKTLTPTNVRITARFTIVDSLKSFASRDHALSATVYLD